MRASSRKRTLDALWKHVWKDVDKSRIRRAKQEAKAGAVVNLSVQSTGIHATVRPSGPTRATYQVIIPLLSDYTAHHHEVVRWLATCPRWVAAHFAGQWDDTFWSFIEENELSVFPDDKTIEKLNWGAKCTCSDWEPLCIHALAVIMRMIADAEEMPLNIFRFVGLDVSTLLLEVHRQSVAMYEQYQPDGIRKLVELPMSADAETSDWMFQVEESAPSGRLVPQFRAEESKT